MKKRLFADPPFWGEGAKRRARGKEEKLSRNGVHCQKGTREPYCGGCGRKCGSERNLLGRKNGGRGLKRP